MMWENLYFDDMDNSMPINPVRHCVIRITVKKKCPKLRNQVKA
jgi:hypothetical protein